MTAFQVIELELSRLKRQLSQAEGALQMALDHLGWQGADHMGYCAEGYGCNVYGDDLLRCECEDCDTFLTNQYGDYITVPIDGLTKCEDCRGEEE